MKAVEKKTVVHDVGVWLPRTKTWLYRVVTQIADRWTPWVVANRTANVEEFPFENVFSLRDRYGYARWFVEMVLCRLEVTRQSISIARFMSSLKPEIVHSHFGQTGWQNMNLVKAIGARHVVSFYGYDVTMVPRNSRLWQERYLDMFRHVDAVLCEGPHMASAIRNLGCPADKLHVYHLGVDLDRIPFRAPTWKEGSPLRVLMAATFTEKKGIPYGLAAVAKLRRQRPDLSIRVTLVGGGSREKGDLNEARVVQEVIGKESLGDIISMPGFLSHQELLKLAQTHDVFLSPSVVAKNGDTEGGAPVGLIEMAAAGLIVASTSHCDIPHVLGSENERLLVGERDVDGLVRVLDELTGNPRQWVTIAEKNRAHIEKEFNIRAQGPLLAEIYEKVLRNGAES